MLNREKYEKELLDLAAEYSMVAVIDNEPLKCSVVACSKCQLNDSEKTCCEMLLEWLDSEYREVE